MVRMVAGLDGGLVLHDISQLNISTILFNWVLGHFIPFILRLLGIICNVES